MKKNNLSKLLLVSLFAFSTFVGCDQTGGSSSSQGEQQVVNGIDIYPIESAVIGEKLNLKDYVKVDGSTDEFVAEVATPTTAVLDEETNELLIIGEGKVSVFVTAGEYEQLLEFNAISQKLNEFKQIIEDLDYNFFLGYYDITTGKISPNGNVYNEQYSLTYYEATQYEPASYQGFIYESDCARNFTVESIDGTDFKIQPGKYSLEYYGPEMWQIYYDLFTTKYYSASESYLYGGMEAAEAMCATLGYNTAANIAKIYEPLLIQEGYIQAGEEVSMAVYVEFLNLPSVNEEGDIVNITSPQISLFLTAPSTGRINIGVNFYLLTDEASYTLDYVEDVINNNSYPALIQPTTLLDKVNEISEAKNYTLDVHASWRVNKTGEDTTPPEGIDPGFLDSWFDYDTTQYVTEKVVLSQFSEDLYTKYELEDDGKVYFSSNIDDASGDWETWTQLLEPIREESKYTDIWGGSSDSYNRVMNSVANDSASINGINVVDDSSEDDKEECDYVLSSAIDGYKYITSVMSLIPFYGPSLANWYSQTLAAYRNASLAELYLLNAYFYVSEDELKVEFVISWDGTVSYITTMTFKDVGTTVIPA